MELCKIRMRYVSLSFALACLFESHSNQLSPYHLQASQIEACSALSTLARSRAFEVRLYARGHGRELYRQLSKFKSCAK